MSRNVISRSALKLLFAAGVLGVSVVALLAIVGFGDPVFAFNRPSWISNHLLSTSNQSSGLAELALGKVLGDASPIFGMYNNADTKTSTWMSAYPDDTLIVHMNIPGTHDAATWNYSHATQHSLGHITELVNDIEVDPTAYDKVFKQSVVHDYSTDVLDSRYRCQDRSMLYMLNAGIRVLDLRYAFDVTNSTLVFWHGPGLQSETATVDDVLFGFYQWLDDHPSEAIFLSFQYEGSTTMYNIDNAGVQLQLYNCLTSAAAKRYILQARDEFRTLGEARGKITLLRRFDLDQLPSSYEAKIPGIHFSPTVWTDNSPNLSLVYNNATGSKAYIEDYYQPLTPHGSSAERNIQWKLNTTESHLRMAAATHVDSLFWTFASSTNMNNVPPDTPRIQALGNGSLTSGGGVNHRLVPFFEQMQGKRVGIVMFDFFEQPATLLPLFLSLLPPPGHASG